jgi:hypothetical protein
MMLWLERAARRSWEFMGRGGDGCDRVVEMAMSI